MIIRFDALKYDKPARHAAIPNKNPKKQCVRCQCVKGIVNCFEPNPELASGYESVCTACVKLAERDRRKLRGQINNNDLLYGWGVVAREPEIE